jgi:hypothetical protein
MFIAAATRGFVTDLVRERTSSGTFSLSNLVRFYVRDVDFDQIREGVRSDGEVTILTGLLSQKNLSIVAPDAMRCNPVGQLVEWPHALLNLAICYGRALFASEQATERDMHTFTRNMVTVLYDEQEKEAWIIQRARRHRIIGHWMLRDGGAERPRAILGGAFLTAREITIYDRFFRQSTLDAIVDAMEFAVVERGGRSGVTSSSA